MTTSSLTSKPLFRWCLLFRIIPHFHLFIQCITIILTKENAYKRILPNHKNGTYFWRYQLESIICARTWGRLFVTQACLTSGNLGQLWITLPVHDHHKQWRGSITWLFLICPKLFPTINPPPEAHYCTSYENFEWNCWNAWEVVHCFLPPRRGDPMPYWDHKNPLPSGI